ncbi:MAG TPA: YlxR family protein [Candidatus Kryptonia bacterium]|nr:YlxR family protein [Candidatus Kryptonia bacterium]
MSKVVQLRTCVGCGARAPQSTLLRFAVQGGGVAPDGRKRAPGRGGYLHRDPACWSRFAQRKGPVRSLRRSLSRAEREDLVARLRVNSEL